MAGWQFNKYQSALTAGIIAVILAIAILLSAHAPAYAHVSQQGFIMLLPTKLYIFSGAAAVAITTLVIALMPAAKVKNLFNSFNTGIPINIGFKNATSVAATILLSALLLIGIYGPHDPLEHLLPLFIWTLWWQGFVTFQAVFGNLWRWVNPWTGFYCLIRGRLERPGLLRLPVWLGISPAIVAFVCFSIFSLIDLAPDNPPRLAIIIAGYWLYTMFGMVIFGARDWLARGECFTILLRYFALLSPFAIKDQKLHIALPGWRLAHAPAPAFGIGIFAIIILATGSFDGLNETFWWLGKIGVNPLEFPGRSQVVLSNLLGLLSAQILLPLCFAILVFTGLKLSGDGPGFGEAFAIFAVSLFPIAFGYHFSHYLTAFLVNFQYSVSALSDPLETGADYLNLGEFYVTSGFLNSADTVKIIWLLQAAFVVGGHLVAVLLSHYLAVNSFKHRARTTLAQLPLAIFMIAYTIFGLWLLASPRGL